MQRTKQVMMMQIRLMAVAHEAGSLAVLGQVVRPDLSL